MNSVSEINLRDYFLFSHKESNDFINNARYLKVLELKQIQQEVQRRGIKHLLHFTKISNLKWIVGCGLITRNKIPSEYINQICNDQLRLDGTHGICLSVSFPNYQMFYRYRNKFPDDSWAVIGLSPEILWEKNCFFNYTNAASRAARNIPWEQKNGIFGFNKMFSDLSAKRSDLCIPEEYTTDPQAEIIVLDDIEEKFILGYAVGGRNDFNVISSNFPNINVHIFKDLFSYRNDFWYWKSEKGNL